MSKAQMNDKQRALLGAVWDSNFSPMDEPKPAVTVEIDGRVFEAVHRKVNRKCYDFMPTPTLSLKMDGKRIALKAALQLLGA